MIEHFILEFTNLYGEKHYFISLGNPWPHRPEYQLISKTTPKRERAAKFETVPEALEVLVKAGDPQGWIVVAA